jgi:RNA polymerase sigma-54 factor
MKAFLQLKLNQQLTLTPQLQQSIRLLQLSTVDLRQEIQQAIDTNPMLELMDEKLESPPEAVTAYAEEQPITAADQQRGTDWQHNSDHVKANNQPGGQTMDWQNYHSVPASLQDHLLWQLNLSHLSDSDRLIGAVIIDAIDAKGYLTQELTDIQQALNGVSHETDYSLDEIAAVLHFIQQFDPPGVGADNLQQCLTLQLAQLAADTPYLSAAFTLVAEYLEQLAQADLAQLKRLTRLPAVTLAGAIKLIRSLNPYPGNSVVSQPAEYIVPDLLVKYTDQGWRVDLNSMLVPKLSLNPHYAALVRRADNDRDNLYMRNQLQQARWLIKSLQGRNQTLLQVAECIVERQQDFLACGEEAMKPLILYDVAQSIGIHESTVSRITRQKYICTPQGVFELKYFFSSQLTTDSGSGYSSIAVRALIKKLVTEENPAKPLSDAQIAAKLAGQGIQVARRTIAKYRQFLNILSSNARKRWG